MKDFIAEGQWNRQKLLTYISDEDIVNYIYSDLKPPTTEEGSDKAWWMGNSKGAFSVKSAWEIVRIRRPQEEINKHLWTKGIPLKINFSF